MSVLLKMKVGSKVFTRDYKKKNEGRVMSGEPQAALGSVFPGSRVEGASEGRTAEQCPQNLRTVIDAVAKIKGPLVKILAIARRLFGMSGDKATKRGIDFLQGLISKIEGVLQSPNSRPSVEKGRRCSKSN
jgi:hypothetical protein